MKEIIQAKIIDREELTIEKARAGCFVVGMSNEEYHSFSGISNSGLSKLDRSPAHFQQSQFKTTRNMVVGSALHAAILEPETFESDFVLLPTIADRRAGEYKEAAKQFGPDAVLIKSECAQVSGMVASIEASEDCSFVRDVPGWRELSAFVECPETGALMRCRYDLLTEDGVSIDLKTTRDVRPEQFAKSVATYRYHVQQAMYSDIFELITGDSIPGFFFLAIESSAPFSCAMYELDDEAIEIGDHLYRDGVKTYAHCARNNTWPGPNAGGVISLPYWAVAEFENTIGESIV